MPEITLPSNSDSEQFDRVPQGAEGFGTIPNDSESFRNLQNAAEGNENHTLTVRKVARKFEAEGVARTERSIINWCQPNKSGVTRLDCYFDPNDRKYFVTPQSVELAIREEEAKAARAGSDSDPTVNTVGRDKPLSSSRNEITEETEQRMKSIEHEVRDLEITNRVKDLHIEKLQEERDGFVNERKEYVEKLMTFSRRVGELETRLLQIGGPTTPRGSITDHSPGLRTVGKESGILSLTVMIVPR